MLSYQIVDLPVGECDGVFLHRIGIYVDRLAADLTSGKLFDHECRQLQYVHGGVGVGAALVAERGVGGESVASGCAAHRGGVEACALDEYVGGLLCDSGVESAEYSGDAHRFGCIANHEVGCRKLSLHSVECGEGRAFGTSPDFYASAVDFRQVEAVEWLAESVEYVVGDVHDVVDRPLSDGCQAIAQPFGAFGHLDSADGDSAVARAELCVADADAYGAVGAVGAECVD